MGSHLVPPHAHLQTGSLGRWGGARGRASRSFPRAQVFFAGLAHPVLPRGRVQEPGFRACHSPALSQGTELALCFNSQGSPSGHWGREEDAASWEPPQRLFPWFLWEKIQKKKSIPAEREGVGWDWAWLSGALGALGRCEVLVKPRQRFYSQWALGRAGWASSPPDPLRPLGSSLHSWPTGQVQFHGNFGS